MPAIRRQRRRFTYDSFIQRATDKYGEKFDYSGIALDSIVDGKSLVKIRCKDCDYVNIIQAKQHISANVKIGCIRCIGHETITLEMFISKSREKYDDIFDYSLIKDIDIKNCKSLVPIRCNTCNLIWRAEVGMHISKIRHGCPGCAGNRLWNYDRIKETIKDEKFSKYDYSLIKRDEIYHHDSNISIICKNCKSTFTKSIRSHFNGGCGCPCEKPRSSIPWNPTRFIFAIQKKHGDNYEFINLPELFTLRTRVNLKCKNCERVWSTKAFEHLENSRKCNCLQRLYLL